MPHPTKVPGPYIIMSFVCFMVIICLRTIVLFGEIFIKVLGWM